ncbi:MAG: hypothetical protein IJ993_05560, partial [Akkermansia sp.]|nr:hypothetical protein [Akkermansia sp.]
MKLHLPKGLRKAVMACMAALTTLTTTVGTGIITGGAIVFTAHTANAEALTNDAAEITENITIGEGNSYELNSTGNQVVKATIDLAGGTLQAFAGANNRVKTIQELTGSGKIQDNNWNTLWQIDALNGDGNITWETIGTHTVASILYINGGNYGGELTYYKTTGQNLWGNGAYQTVVQINEGGANTMQNAVLNLAGKDAERYSMLALNATTVALKGLKGTAHSIIYAGEQSTANNTCVNKPTGSGAATLSIKNNGETDYVYGGEIVSGVTLALNGGKQTLGNAIVNGNITVNQGALTVDGGKLNGTVSVSANGQLTATGAITLLNAISSAGTVDISGLESLTLGSNIIDSAQNEGAITTYTIINGGTIAGAEALTSDILKATIQADGIQTNGTDWTFANGKLVVTLTSEELTWSGGNLTWQDGAVLDDGGVFDQEDSVTFKTAGALTATLAEDITALNV